MQGDFWRRFLLISTVEAFLCTFSISAHAACHVKGCPPYSTHPTALPQNQTIAVVANGTVPSDAAGPLANALSTVGGQGGATQNGTGDSFQQYATADAAYNAVGNNGAIVNITFDTTTTAPPPCGKTLNPVACSSYPPTTGNVSNGGQITVYLKSQNCGGPCFDSSQSGYAAAIQGVIEHELYHGLGIGDTSTPGYIMSPYSNISSSGINGSTYLSNNAGGTTSPQPCDKKETQRASTQRATGVACPS